MKTLSGRLEILLLGLIIALGLSNCNKEKVTDFIIELDRMEVQDTVIRPDTINITVYGTIGPNDCYKYKDTELEQQDTVITLTFRGEKTEGKNVACKTGEQKLNGTLGLMIESAGTYIIKARQPDKSFLQDTVVVE